MKIRLIIISVSILFFSCKSNVENDAVAKALPQIDYAVLGSILDSIHTEDQQYRRKIESIKDSFGWESDEMKNHWKIISATDSSNLVVVKQILDEHGWLGRDEIGGTANSTLFLVIQHADQTTQEQYLPMIRKAVKDGKANARSLAMLEDRIGLGKGEMQIYGSQIGTDPESGKMYVLPLSEPETVNERRLAVGLGPIEDYVAHWDLVWDVEEYKKNLPKYIKQLKSKSR